MVVEIYNTLYGKADVVVVIVVVAVVAVVVNVPVVFLPSRLESFPNDFFGLESKNRHLKQTEAQLFANHIKLAN